MPASYDDVYVRDLHISDTLPKETAFVGETKTGTKLFPLNSLKNFIFSKQVFNTISDLKKSTELKEHDLCYTLGYRRANDGGGGIYVITYDPTVVEDKGLVHTIETNNVLRANLVNSLNFVNVQLFGAYGDGIHDDTKYIQRALDSGLSVHFTAGKTYKITNTLKIKKSNQVINMNRATIVPYNCYAFSIEGSESVRVENVTIYDMSIRCNNNGGGVRLMQNTKNIVFEHFMIHGVNASNKAFVMDSTEKVYLEDGIINGTNYSGQAFLFRSTDEQNRERYITCKNVTVKDCEKFAEIAYQDSTTILVFDSCSFINQDMVSDNYSRAFYLDGTLPRMSISNFTSWNVETFMYMSSGFEGIVNVRDLYVYDNTSVFNLNSLNSNTNVELSGIHRYLGVSRAIKNNVFSRMYTTLHNNATMICDDMTYDMIYSAADCPGKLIDHHNPEVLDEIEYHSEVSTLLQVGVATNARYDWTGELVLKNIHGFEGQILYIRSSTGQEISSGGNIILYPQTPDRSFKEAMPKLVPYKFKCVNGSWIKLDY